MTSPLYIRATKNGFIVEVLVAPRAKRSHLVGLHGGYPKIALAAPPIEGRANEALVEFLAKLLKIPRRNIGIVRGGASKRKALEIQGVTKEILQSALESVGKYD